jgi:hypothetical protein
MQNKERHPLYEIEEHLHKFKGHRPLNRPLKRVEPSPEKTFDVSFPTTSENFELLKRAGQMVGLRVDQVTTLIHSVSGTEIPIPEGQVGVRYMTTDAKLLTQFNTQYAKLAAAQQTPLPKG